MKKRLFSILLCLSLLFTTALTQPLVGAVETVWDGSVSAGLTGSGTSADPYLIKTGADLAYVAKQVNSGVDFQGKVIAFENDIYLNKDSDDFATWGTLEPKNVWTPIGNNSKYFRGIIDGKDHVVYGAYIKGSDSDKTGNGLFGATHNNSINNLHIKNSYVRGLENVGGIVGISQSTVFTNCSFHGYIYTANAVHYAGACGGILGSVSGGNVDIVCCYTEGVMDSYGRHGGLVGSIPGSGLLTINNSYSIMDLTKYSATTDATSNYSGQAGGLLGFCNSTTVINNSFFAGKLFPLRANNPNRLGAIVGMDNGYTNNVVPLEGTPKATGSNNYYLSDTDIGEGYNKLGIYKSATQFKDSTVVKLLNTDASTPVFKQGDDYPVFVDKESDAPPEPTNEVLSSELFTDWATLASNSFDSGAGKATDPYIIKTAEQLAKISADVLMGETFSGKYFKIENDIVLNNNTDYNNWVNLTEGTLYRWTPIGSGTTMFKGNIDGQGHTITGMYVNKTLLYGKVDYPDETDNYVGFIGNGSGKISNLHFAASYVCGFRWVGGIAGQYGGKITNCSFSGYIRSTNNANTYGNIGGIVGAVNGSADINECYTIGKMNAISRAGGLIGSIVSNGNSTISYSYSEMTFDSKIANDGVTETKSGIGGLVGFAQLGTIGVKTSFYYGLLGVSTGTYGPIIGQIVTSGANKATFSNQGNVYYLEGNNNNNYGSAISQNNFSKKGFLSYFTDGYGIVRATLDTDKGDKHPMLYPVYQKVIDTTFVDYTFNKYPETLSDYDKNPDIYKNDGLGLSAKRDGYEFEDDGEKNYIGTALSNYGTWGGNPELRPYKKFANGEGYGVGFNPYLGATFARISMSDVDPELFYTFTVDAKVIKADPNITVQIGFFRNCADSGSLAFRDENSNTYDTAIKTVKVKLDKLTDYKTYTVQISGAEIIEFCEEYTYYPSQLYFGIYCPQFVLDTKYKDIYVLATDNYKMVQSAVPNDYVPMSNIVATDILDSNPTATYGEHLYNFIENSSFEDELTGVWANLPSGVTVKTATAKDTMFGDKYLSLSNNAKISVPVSLSKNKFYNFGISIRGMVGSSYKVYLSDSPNGSPLADIDEPQQQFNISGKGTGSTIRKGIYFRNTMKTGTTLYLVLESIGGTVDFDEITLTNKTVWQKNKNYYKNNQGNKISVYDTSDGSEKIVTIADGKSIYDLIN